MIIQEARAKEIPLIYNLYMEAFPLDERKPFTLIEEKVKKGQMEILAIKEREEFLGLAITILHGELVLIDYFAMEEKHRGKGVGGRALEMLKERYQNQSMFLEIEVLDEKASNYLDRVRRKAFYLSHGMKETGIYVSLFGVEVELLVAAKEVTYEAYHSIFTDIFGEELAKKVYRLK